MKSVREDEKRQGDVEVRLLKEDSIEGQMIKREVYEDQKTIWVDNYHPFIKRPNQKENIEGKEKEKKTEEGVTFECLEYFRPRL